MDPVSQQEDSKKLVQEQSGQLQQSPQVQLQAQMLNNSSQPQTQLQSNQKPQIQQTTYTTTTTTQIKQQAHTPTGAVQLQPSAQTTTLTRMGQPQQIQLQQQPGHQIQKLSQSPQIQQLTQSNLTQVSTSQPSLCTIPGTTPPIVFQLAHPRGVIPTTTQIRPQGTLTLTPTSTTTTGQPTIIKTDKNKYICYGVLDNGINRPDRIGGNQTFTPGIQRIAIPIQRHPIMTPRATILQQPTLIRGVTTQQGIGLHQVAGQPLGLRLQTTPTIIHHQSPTPNATPPSQMTPEDALAKGTSFFQSLLTNKAVGKDKKHIKEIIQDFIDRRKTSEEFAIALQKEMNSGPQGQLVPFLDLLLPYIRQALDSGTIKLPGIRGPNQRDMISTTPVVIASVPITTTTPSISSPSTSQQKPNDSTINKSPNKQVQSNNNSTPGGTTSVPPTKRAKKTPLPPGQKSKYAIRKEQQEARRKERESLAAAAAAGSSQTPDAVGSVKKEPNANNNADDITKKQSSTGQEKSEKSTSKAKSDKPPRPSKLKKQEKQLESLSSTLRDDDDVNDVAAMGGVNLAEESQRIMASGAELVGTQIRSCKDEPFLDIKVLTTKVAKIAKEYDLPGPSKEVVTLISHATQERLKNMVERLGILAEHRSENLNLNPKYEISTDIKGQMKFLAELDRIEKRRIEEQERELLMKVAKSRSKVEDPEQQKLRQKAKDMQRAEQEEVRQREANETALLAIGPRKKMKTTTSSNSSISSFSQSSSLKELTKTSLDSSVIVNPIKRVKRVNMRDLQFLLELDRTHLNRLIKITAQ